MHERGQLKIPPHGGAARVESTPLCNFCSCSCRYSRSSRPDADHTTVKPLQFDWRQTCDRQFIRATSTNSPRRRPPPRTGWPAAAPGRAPGPPSVPQEGDHQGEQDEDPVGARQGRRTRRARPTPAKAPTRSPSSPSRRATVKPSTSGSLSEKLSGWTRWTARAAGHDQIRRRWRPSQ